MHPVAIVTCVLIVCATVLAVAWLLRAERIDDGRFRDAVETARGEMERTFARALDEAAEISETIKRHRARIDGASRGNPAAPAQPELPLAELPEEVVARLPAAAQREWILAREQRLRRSRGA
jgi:hypothetical protein